VHGRGAGEAGAGRRNGLHHDSGVADAEARTAEILRDADAEPAVGSQGAIELLGKLAVVVALEPIIVAKTRADFFDCVAQRLLKV
jgi:hypothetical protein